MSKNSANASLRQVVARYFAKVYGVSEGPGVVPFYCDPERVGRFAVDPAALALGEEAALFKLFVALSMYQARRDVLIMEQQRRMSQRTISMLASPSRVRRLVNATDCKHLASAEAFAGGCDVVKVGAALDCKSRPGLDCPVKLATAALQRMGDSGKVSVSAWLQFWKAGLSLQLRAILEAEATPAKRAELLVERFSGVHRVGRKLATMYVAALSTPALAPGLAPWFPAVDGNSLVVVDTHVARAVDLLHASKAPRTYESRARWLTRQAARIDLQEFRPDVPSFAPRLVQQALYAFGSKSNRAAAGDGCAHRKAPCSGCVPRLCPFA
ncbi:MAG: hypothetical protein IPJ34_40830 [Myxococcales bacterium]|nr:hypothetical protein [Myxococcales bacterium]